MSLQPFHLAVPVRNLADARRFYGEMLGCAEGRSSEEWVDFDFFGHQLVAHLNVDRRSGTPLYRAADGKDVPVPRFGVVLEWQQWHDLADRLRAAGIHFGVEPGISFQGQAGEQATMFFQDPSGNALEFKAFKNPSRPPAR